MAYDGRLRWLGLTMYRGCPLCCCSRVGSVRTAPPVLVALRLSKCSPCSVDVSPPGEPGSRSLAFVPGTIPKELVDGLALELQVKGHRVPRTGKG